jgi:uncharacterized repeat protein (TIGR02543 family)
MVMQKRASGQTNFTLMVLLLSVCILVMGVLVFPLASCDTSATSSSGSDNPNNQVEYKTYTAYDETGNAFILVVTESETYVLSIQKDNGATLESSTGTVTSSNSTSYTLKSKAGSTFTVIVNVNIIVSINNPIPLDSGGTKSPEGKLSPSKPSGTTTKYTVTFDDNGATSEMAPNAQTVTAGSTIVMPSGSGLSKTGYTFAGWNTNAYGTGANYNAGSSYTVNGNVTLFAKWDANAVSNIDILGTWKTVELNKTFYGSNENLHKNSATYTLTLNADSSYTMEILENFYELTIELNPVFYLARQSTRTEEGTYTISGDTITLIYKPYASLDKYLTRTGRVNSDNNTIYIYDIGYFSRDGSVGTPIRL